MTSLPAALLPADPTPARHRLLAALPKGSGLPAATWSERHRWVMSVLLVQVAALPVFALLRGHGPDVALTAAAAPGLLGLVGLVRVLPRSVRAAAAGLGLVVVSAMVVDLAGGAIEAHFHFFVMVPVVALYQSWLPFGLAVGFVLFHHGVMGTMNPQSVYNHHGAHTSPWRWAAIHASFFAVECLGSIVSWKLHERAAAREAALAADLAWRSRHDDLTGLPNRAVLVEHCAARFARRPGSSGRSRPPAMLAVGLDRVQVLTDTLGHAASDTLVTSAVARIRGVLRTDDLLARLDGAHFAVLLSVTDESDALRCAERIVGAVETAFCVDGVDVDVDVAVGVAVGADTTYDDPQTAAEDLVRRAEMARNRAGREQRHVVLHRAGDDVGGRHRLSLLSDLRRALDDEGQVHLHYQPKVDVSTGEVVGLEALVRWQHPTRGFLGPDEFIGAVEATPLILRLTDRVLELALDQARQWWASGHRIPVAVNVAPRCLVDVELPGRVRDLLAANGLPAAALRVEITETTLMAEPEMSLRTLSRLAELGVGLSIDDFGTGYSSMAYLSRLPVDELKIDRSFVQGLGSPGVGATAGGAPVPGDRDAVIVRSAIDLGHNLGLRVVAEGVEDCEALAELREMGGDIAQGYLIARPMAGPVLTDWLAATGRSVRSVRPVGAALSSAGASGDPAPTGT